MQPDGDRNLNHYEKALYLHFTAVRAGNQGGYALFTFDEYKQALDGAGPKLKELILDRAAQDSDIDLLQLRALVAAAYPEA